ncbi:MAG: dolichyl-phosphate-mannose--protein mannosyltransferase, partial [Acidobacteria bacterium]
MPWTIWLILALADRLRTLWTHREEALATRDSSWQGFLLIWLLVPVLFFSASHSKLPGYILPSIPAGALLVAEYLRSRQRESSKVSLWLVGLHAFVCGALIFVALSAPTIQLNHHLVANKETYVAAAMGVLVM